MRLLNTKTLQLEFFQGGFDTSRTIPRYAILSHTWGENEILFEDIKYPDQDAWKSKESFSKIRGSCELATKHGYDYIWIDACCIDKSSTAELSEAINSMFEWYMHSEVCFAYLSDATHGQSIAECRWFKRGWTLQELIAPSVVSFYDKNWAFIGNSFAMAAELCAITGIDERVFRKNRSQVAPEQEVASMSTDYYVMYPFSRVEQVARQTIRSFSVAQIMHWAKGRETTIKEDMAYCLMGIFEVNMALMYGERDKAFARLQEEILKKTNDHSILAHRDHTTLPNVQTLATSPDAFRDPFILEKTAYDMALSNRRLTVEMLLCPLTETSVGGATHLGILDCYGMSNLLSRPALPLLVLPGHDTTFWRCSDEMFMVDSTTPGRAMSLLEDESDPYSIMISHKIAFYQTKDIQRKRITLLFDKPERLHDSSATIMPPLQITLINNSDDMEEYSIDKSYPQRIGNFLLSMPNSRPIGIASFHKPSAPPFLVTWGKSLWKRPTDDDGNSLWCKISPLDGPEARRASFSSRERAGSIVSRVWREGLDLDNTWSSRDLNSMPEEERQQDSATLGKNRIRAKIRTRTFVERTIAELEVSISDIAETTPRLGQGEFAKRKSFARTMENDGPSRS